MPNFVYKGSYPPYLLILMNFFISLTCDRMGVKIQNDIPTVIIPFQSNFFYIFPVTVLTKLADGNFEI